MTLRLLLCLVLLAPAWPVLAAEGPGEPSLLGATIKMLAALAVIIGLLLLFYAGSRRGFGVLPKKRDGLIKVVETRPLGGRKFLCVVRVRGQELLLGLSNERIETLSQLPPAEPFAQTLQQVEEDRR